MMLLTPILVVPTLAGFLCLVVPSRRVMAALGVLAFGVTLGFGVALLQEGPQRIPGQMGRANGGALVTPEMGNPRPGQRHQQADTTGQQG